MDKCFKLNCLRRSAAVSARYIIRFIIYARWQIKTIENKRLIMSEKLLEVNGLKIYGREAVIYNKSINYWTNFNNFNQSCKREVTCKFQNNYIKLHQIADILF